MAYFWNIFKFKFVFFQVWLHLIQFNLTVQDGLQLQLLLNEIGFYTEYICITKLLVFIDEVVVLPMRACESILNMLTLSNRSFAASQFAYGSSTSSSNTFGCSALSFSTDSQSCLLKGRTQELGSIKNLTVPAVAWIIE